MFVVAVQVDAEDSFKVLEILSSLKDVPGVKVGDVRAVAQQAQTQVAGSRIGGQPGVTIQKTPTVTTVQPTPA